MRTRTHIHRHNSLKSDFKNLHQKYRTTEASFIYHDLKTLNSEDKDYIEQSSSNGKSILHEYYSLKKNNLFLYDGVFETLKEIKSKGAIIVGFLFSLNNAAVNEKVLFDVTKVDAHLIKP